MEFNQHYKEVYITLQISKEMNALLSEASMRSNRKKIQEATLRLEDHLKRFRSISEINQTTPYPSYATEAKHDYFKNTEKTK